MNKDWEVFAQWAVKLNNSLSQAQLEKFQTYHQLLLRWNQKINLVSRHDIQRIISYHFTDSISAITEIPQNSIIADLGTGAGLPGIPIKISRDDTTLYLIESIKKKANFLNDAIKNIVLTNTNVINQRAESISDTKFDIILVRLFGKVHEVLPLAAQLLNNRGKIIFYKIQGVEKEIRQAEKTVVKYNLMLKSVKDIILPNAGIIRKLIIYEYHQ